MTKAQKIGAVLGDIYDAWRAQNLDWLATYLPDDFSHHINIPPATHPLGGERVGEKAALESLSFSQFDNQRFSTSQIAIDEGRAELEVNTLCLHKPAGAYLDTKKQNIWTLEGGWPARFEEHHDVGRFMQFMQSLES